jgi:polyhydroxyalkanoate synthesis regulator phasin
MSQSANVRRSIASALRWAMLFGVGSALVLQEKTQEFVSQAIEKGQAAQSEGKALVQEMRADKEQKTTSSANQVDTQINATLERFNVPSPAEVRELDQKISELSVRIDELGSDT